MNYRYQPNIERDKILHKLGYSHYNQYLKSDLWKEIIKPKVIKEHGGQCYVCGCKKNLEIHHMDYNKENLSGESTNNMIPLCGRCHEKIEFKKVKGSTVKVSLEQANSRLTDLIVKKRGKINSKSYRNWKDPKDRKKGWKKRKKDRNKYNHWDS
tara:strand:- start:104 stop:565 length:462 start_codon:yes stop_codon:yes gene_type:complete